jgi:hypothetical protein
MGDYTPAHLKLVALRATPFEVHTDALIEHGRTCSDSEYEV